MNVNYLSHCVFHNESFNDHLPVVGHRNKKKTGRLPMVSYRSKRQTVGHVAVSTYELFNNLLPVVGHRSKWQTVGHIAMSPYESFNNYLLVVGYRSMYYLSIYICCVSTNCFLTKLLHPTPPLYSFAAA